MVIERIDITKDVDFLNNDDKVLPIIKCKCGHKFQPWNFIISIYDNDPTECLNCGCKLYFENFIRVYEVKEQW